MPVLQQEKIGKMPVLQPKEAGRMPVLQDRLMPIRPQGDRPLASRPNTLFRSWKTSISKGQGVIESEPQGKAAQELRALYNELQSLL